MHTYVRFTGIRPNWKKEDMVAFVHYIEMHEGTDSKLKAPSTSYNGLYLTGTLQEQFSNNGSNSFCFLSF